MITEKSTLTQTLMERLSTAASKVPFIKDEALAKALQYLELKGIPNHKHEDYKYCNIEAVLKKDFVELGQQFTTSSGKILKKNKSIVQLVLLNGKFSKELSDPLVPGLEITDFAQLESSGIKQIGSVAEAEQDAFVELNTAFCGAGLKIRVAANQKIEKPVRVTNIVSSGSNVLLNYRNILHLEQGAEAQFIFEQINEGGFKIFCNSLSERIVEKGAKLTCTELQHTGGESYTVNTIWTRVQEHGLYDCNTISSGGKLIRNNHNVKLSGEYAAAHLYGLLSSCENQLIDNHTLMDHRVPNCESNELYKGIADGKSTGVFNGKIFVRKDAQKTNAYQSSKNILLSDDASIYTKPQLEIYANDVKCSHGTSTGKIDEQALFYLKARGIGENSARRMLLQAFAEEVIQRLEPEELRLEVEQWFENKI